MSSQRSEIEIRQFARRVVLSDLVELSYLIVVALSSRAGRRVFRLELHGVPAEMSKCACRHWQVYQGISMEYSDRRDDSCTKFPGYAKPGLRGF